MPQLRLIPLPLIALLLLASHATGMSPIRVSDDHRGFVYTETGKPFVLWGFNYDHDRDNRLLDDYWITGWKDVESDFAEMKALGANVVRIHLQFGRFMTAPDQPNAAALDQLGKLLTLAERDGLYLDVTGLACYEKSNIPAWYDKLDESHRWAAQANFWKAVAGKCADSPAVFCYDLMNEPVVAGGKKPRTDWLGGPLGNRYFVQFITLAAGDRPRPEVARQWIHQLVAAVRSVDTHHLITVGMVPWSLDRPGLSSGFVPDKVAGELDFIAVHLYPKHGKVDDALDTLHGFAIGKPIIIEEMFPLGCTTDDLEQFITASHRDACGWIGFYWGKTRAEYRAGKTIGDAITLGWLDLFAKMKLAR